MQKEKYVAIGAQVHAHLQWIHESNEESKFFNFLKRKLVADGFLGLHQANRTLEENPTNIQGMFNNHFQKKIFLPSIRFDCDY